MRVPEAVALCLGDDFLTVYRLPSGASTSIELFKCQAAAAK
jgi:hypothetical protein